MARLAPAACNPCAIDQAILRLLATPKTAMLRPSRLWLMTLLKNWKAKNISSVPVRERWPSDKAAGNADVRLLRRTRDGRDGLRLDGPNGADESSRIHRADDGETPDQSDIMRRSSHRISQHHLQER